MIVSTLLNLTHRNLFLNGSRKNWAYTLSEFCNWVTKVCKNSSLHVISEKKGHIWSHLFYEETLHVLVDFLWIFWQESMMGKTYNLIGHWNALLSSETDLLWNLKLFVLQDWTFSRFDDGCLVQATFSTKYCVKALSAEKLRRCICSFRNVFVPSLPGLI